MSTTVAEMTVNELKELISAVIEEKLSELISEDRLEINEQLHYRLLEQKKRVDDGERGVSLDDVLGDLGLN